MEQIGKSITFQAVRAGNRQVLEGQEVRGRLVRHQGDSWEPVDSVQTAVSGADLKSSYGLWNDREIVKGHLFKKTVRPLDDQVQNDEVTPLSQRYTGEQKLDNFYSARVSQATLSPTQPDGMGTPTSTLTETWNVSGYYLPY